MTAILRTALLAALAAAAIPAVAAGQDTSSASLLRRIELLERANTDLEQRVRDVEALIRRAPSRDQQVAGSGDWRDISNWRRLRKGMKPDQVRALLGEPERVEGGDFMHWYWADAYVIFYSGKLDRWSEPR